MPHFTACYDFQPIILTCSDLVLATTQISQNKHVIHPSAIQETEHHSFASLPSSFDFSQTQTPQTQTPQTQTPQTQHSPKLTHRQSTGSGDAAAQALEVQNHAPPLPQTLPASAPGAPPHHLRPNAILPKRNTPLPLRCLRPLRPLRPLRSLRLCAFAVKRCPDPE